LATWAAALHEQQNISKKNNTLVIAAPGDYQ